MGAIATGVGVWNQLLNVITQGQADQFANRLSGAGAGVKGNA